MSKLFLPKGIRTLSRHFTQQPLLIDLVWLTLVVIVAYASAIPGDFVWIDHVEIDQGGYRVTNAQDLGSIWTLSLDQYLERDHGMLASRGGYWRPIYALSLSLDWLLWQDRAWCYHIENILWHLLVVIGLYLLGQRMFGALPAGRSLVFWATLLFAIHPLGVHSVTWISGRKDAMCAAFGVGSLLAFSQLSHTPEEETPKGGHTLWIVISAVCMLLAAGSKELGMMVPLAAMILLWPMSGLVEGRRPKASFAQWLGLGVLWECAFVVGVYRLSVLGGVGLNAAYPSDSLLKNVATSATLWWHYIGKILLPGESSPADTWPVTREMGSLEGLAILGIGMVAALLAYGTYRRWVLMPAFFWFLIWTIPSTGLVPLRHFRAERYLYPASWGLLLAAVILAFQLWRKLRGRVRIKQANIVFSGIAIWLLVITAYGNTFWWNDATLFGRAVDRTPNYIEGRLALANLALESGNYEKTAAYSQQAIEDALDPNYVSYWSPFVAYTNQGLALYHLNRPVAAMAAFQSALQYRPNNAIAQYHVGLAAFALNQLPIAKEHYLRAVELRPDDFLARSNLAVTLLHLGEAKQSVEILLPLIQSRPDDIQNLTNLTSGLLILGQFQTAEEHLAKIVRQYPDDPGYQAKLAWAQWGAGKPEQAQQNLKQARQKSPSHATVLYVSDLMGL